MNSTMNDPVDWFALGAWFESARDVMDELTACASLAGTLVKGDPPANLVVVRDLDTRVRRTATWFSTFVCPEAWVRDFAVGIISVLSDIRETTLRSEGAPSTSDERFVAKVIRAELMVREFRSIAERLHVYAGLDFQNA